MQVQDGLVSTYPKPIVNHEAAAQQAKQRISAVRKSDGFRGYSKQVYQKHGSRKRTPRKTPKNTQDGQLNLFGD
jgi:deoxyribodipyrimidine photo-lyase